MKKAPTSTYQEITPDYLRNKLKLKHLEVKQDFTKKYGQAEKFLLERGVDLGKIRQHSAKILGAGALAGTLLFNPPVGAKPVATSHAIHEKVEKRNPQKLLIDELGKLLPEKARPLSREEEKHLEKVFGEVVGVPAKASLEGEHLNTTYGYIGAEQHLRRFPGDTMANHPGVLEDDEGMAPGLGAWGYFAPSRDKLGRDLVETEKWYAVVQTLYLPDWSTRQPYLRDWYKYRKVLIVNTKNGNAVVAAIADAGPAAWTGKHFGGSPEVMNYLGGPRYKKGPVVLFFVDDPENKIPLGPVEYNKAGLAGVKLIRV